MPGRAITPPDPPVDTSAAFAPVIPPREPQEYRVVGKREVCETKHGQTFTHLFTPEQEAALIEGGHIEPTKKG